MRDPASLNVQSRFQRSSIWSHVSFTSDSQVQVQDGTGTNIIDPTSGQLRVRIQATSPWIIPDMGKAVALDFVDGQLTWCHWDLNSGVFLGMKVMATCIVEQMDDHPHNLPRNGLFLIRSPDSRIESQFERWVRKFHIAEPFLSDHSDVHTVFDLRTGEELTSFQPPGYPSVSVSPNGKTLGTLEIENRGSLKLWDIPPRKSLKWFAVGAALLALPIAFVARRRVRKLRAA